MRELESFDADTGLNIRSTTADTAIVADMLTLGGGRYFIEVARSDSIRQAAERLRIAPSAISRQIARLEHGLNTRLVERRADGVTLTEAGRVLLSHLEAIQDRLDRISGDVADLNALRRGTVHIATVEGITRPFLSEQIARFRLHHPGVAFHLRACGRQRVLEALEQRRAQIGFLYDHFSHPALVEAKRWCQPLLALAPPNHPLMGRQGLTLTDLAAEPCALPDETFGIHHLVRRVYARSGLSINAPVIGDNLAFLCDHAIRCSMITYMPRQAAQAEIERGQLAPLDLVCPEFRHRHIYAVVRRDQTLPPAAQAFLDRTLEAFDQEAQDELEAPGAEAVQR